MLLLLIEPGPSKYIVHIRVVKKRLGSFNVGNYFFLVFFLCCRIQ